MRAGCSRCSSSPPVPESLKVKLFSPYEIALYRSLA